MGGRHRAGETAPDERNNDVHVRQHPANIFYNDGIHVIQKSRTGYLADKHGFCKVRVGGYEGEAGAC